jgi:hypothetical protein
MFIAEEDLLLSNYAVIDTTYNNGQVSNLNRNFYRFPTKIVKKGEYVILYTQKGKDFLGKTNMGLICHYFYWGLAKEILNNNEVESIQVLKVQTVSTKKAA